jgi:hypothetical protein
MEDQSLKNPKWGGARLGAGRRPSSVRLTAEEVQLLLKNLQGFKKDSPVGHLAVRLRVFLDQSSSSSS